MLLSFFSLNADAMLHDGPDSKCNPMAPGDHSAQERGLHGNPKRPSLISHEGELTFLSKNMQLQQLDAVEICHYVFCPRPWDWGFKEAPGLASLRLNSPGGPVI